MKKKKQSASTTTTGLFNWRGIALQKQDWCFDDCTASEANYCLQYECLREINYYRQRASKLKKLTPRQAAQVDPILAPVLKSFPDTPWLLIPADNRKAAVKLHRARLNPRFAGLLNSYLGGFDNASVEDLQAADATYRNAKWNKDFLYRVVRINLHWPVERLRDAFEDWLRDNLPPVCKPKDDRAGRGGAYDQLWAIGARRMLQAYGFTKAARMMDETLGTKIRFSDARAMRRAEKRAGQLLAKYALGTTA